MYKNSSELNTTTYRGSTPITRNHGEDDMLPIFNFYLRLYYNNL